ncbi:hypothetical protein PCL_09560 [Purpureocillium lilacinum]|uniref:F-box domain-containing protein n=1 Tax=Purpureocillium lilacinum TaxID=33203 RepID=A0A2U3DQL6_PURLI|nr:hypothetical protein PCL_09560 [Purpureocillium lilacinum]
MEIEGSLACDKMDASSVLSWGSLAVMFNDQIRISEGSSTPVVQCLQVNTTATLTRHGDDFYRMVVSDGEHYVHAALGPRRHHLIHSGKLLRGCICRLTEFTSHTVKDKSFLLLHDLEVIQSLGVRKKIGEPATLIPKVHSESISTQTRFYRDGTFVVSKTSGVSTGPKQDSFQAKGEYVGIPREPLPSRKAGAAFRVICPAAGQPALDPNLAEHVGLLNVPAEVFDLIATYLSPGDKVALSLTSKAAYTLVEPSIYSLVVLTTYEAFANFSSSLTFNPNLCALVRTYVVSGTESWRFVHSVDKFTALREFMFRLDSIERTSTRLIVEAISTLATSHWTRPTCKLCHIILSYDYFADMPVEVGEKLLWKVFSAPSLETVTACYQNQYGRYTSRTIIKPRPPPRLDAVQFTALKELRMRWDGLTLPWLFALLHFPAQLEVLVLQFSKRFSTDHPDEAMTLDAALEPAANTLQCLIIDAVDNYDDDGNWYAGLEDSDLKWSDEGLSAFKKLEYLGVPSSSLGCWPLDGLKTTLTLPASLITLYLTDAKLIPLELSMASATLGGQDLHTWPLTFHDEAALKLHHLSMSLYRLPLLQYLEVRDYDGRLTQDDKKGVNMDLLRSDPPPVMVDESDGQTLVDRRIVVIFRPRRGYWSYRLQDRLPPIWKYDLHRSAKFGSGAAWDERAYLGFAFQKRL